jgi:ferredoxin-NADP reductase
MLDDFWPAITRRQRPPSPLPRLLALAADERGLLLGASDPESRQNHRKRHWQVAEVADSVRETPRVVTIVLDAPGWPGHRAGQHLDVRLTAEDGYQAQRSYSIASAPGEPLAITVERLDDGEVSPYLADELRAGDGLEIRGPIGGYFVWEPSLGGPLLLLAGGSGVVPLMAMLRHRATSGSDSLARLLYSSRAWEDVIYREELERLAADDGVDVVYALTRSQPPGWTGYARRLDVEMLREVAWPPEERIRVFVCGPTSFVETAADALVEAGYAPGSIRTERFGATGG